MSSPNFGNNTAFQITPYLVDVFNSAYDKAFSSAFAAAQPQADFVEERTTPGKFINLAGAMAAAPVHIWRNDKTLNRLNHFFAPVPLFPLETSISIDKYDFKADNIGLYMDDVKNLGSQAALFKDVGTAIALQSGYSSEYSAFWSQAAGNSPDFDFGESGNITGDGLPLFASGSAGAPGVGGGHYFGPTQVGNTQNNIVYGNLEDPTTWAAARALMHGFRNDKGQPLRVRSTGIVHSTPDEYKVWNALDAKEVAPGYGFGPTAIAAGGTGHAPVLARDNVLNINRMGWKFHKLDTLDNNPGVAYLIGEIGAVKAGYQYMMDPLHLVPSIAPDTVNMFRDKQMLYSVEGYGRIIFPTWFTVIRVVDPSATYQ